MPKKMRTTRNLLLMATLLGSALFARAADKEMTIGAIYLDTQGYYAGVRQGVQDAAKDSSVQVQLIETNAQGDISKESTFVDTECIPVYSLSANDAFGFIGYCFLIHI